MEILKFDELKKVQVAPKQQTGCSGNVKANQNMKRKLIASAYCSSIKVLGSGCCSGK